MNDQQVWMLIANKLSGEASASELQQLDGYLQKNSSLAEKMRLLSDVWHTPVCCDPQITDAAFERLIGRINTNLLH